MIFICFYIIISKQASHQGNNRSFGTHPEHTTDDDNQSLVIPTEEQNNSFSDIHSNYDMKTNLFQTQSNNEHNNVPNQSQPFDTRRMQHDQHMLSNHLQGNRPEESNVFKTPIVYPQQSFGMCFGHNLYHMHSDSSTNNNGIECGSLGNNAMNMESQQHFGYLNQIYYPYLNGFAIDNTGSTFLNTSQGFSGFYNDQTPCIQSTYPQSNFYEQYNRFTNTNNLTHTTENAVVGNIVNYPGENAAITQQTQSKPFDNSVIFAEFLPHGNGSNSDISEKNPFSIPAKPTCSQETEKSRQPTKNYTLLPTQRPMQPNPSAKPTELFKPVQENNFSLIAKHANLMKLQQEKKKEYIELMKLKHESEKIRTELKKSLQENTTETSNEKETLTSIIEPILQTQENLNIKIDSLDIDFLKEKKRKNESFDIEKICTLVKTSLEILKSEKELLKKGIEKSLEYEQVKTRFIYNYFFDNDLRIKKEFVLLILTLSEVNCITTLFDALENKNVNNLTEESKQSYIDTVFSLIEAYIDSLENFNNGFKKIRCRSYAVVIEYLCDNLKQEIKNFRDMNIKLLEELIIKNDKEISSTSQNTVFDKNTNEILKSEDEFSLFVYFNKKYEKNIIELVPLPKHRKRVVQDYTVIKHNKSNSSDQIKGDTTENNISLLSNSALISYYNLSTIIPTSDTSAGYKDTNSFFLMIFLNRDWLESLSSDYTKFLPMEILEFTDLTNKMETFGNIKKFLVLHNNLHLFLKILFRKYNCIINEEFVDFKVFQHTLTFKDKAIRTLGIGTDLEYFYYMFDRYSEYLLEYYI